MATHRLKGLWIPADILLDEKLTRDEAKGRYVHNEKKQEGIQIRILIQKEHI